MTPSYIPNFRSVYLFGQHGKHYVSMTYNIGVECMEFIDPQTVWGWTRRGVVEIRGLRRVGEPPRWRGEGIRADKRGNRC